MSIYYDLATQLLSRSHDHSPMAWESIYPFEEAHCWNCGGEFMVERRGSFGNMEQKACWLCNATGVLQFSIEPITYQMDWYYNPSLYNLKYLNGETNFWWPW